MISIDTWLRSITTTSIRNITTTTAPHHTRWHCLSASRAGDSLPLPVSSPSSFPPSLYAITRSHTPDTITAANNYANNTYHNASTTPTTTPLHPPTKPNTPTPNSSSSPPPSPTSPATASPSTPSPWAPATPASSMSLCSCSRAASLTSCCFGWRVDGGC